MTKKERAERAFIKKKLQDEGIIPLDKPRINKRRYVNEIAQKFKSRREEVDLMPQIAAHVILSVLGSEKNEMKISDDTMAFARIIDLVMREAEYSAKVRSEGREYSLEEYRDEVYNKVYPTPQYAKKSNVEKGEA